MGQNMLRWSAVFKIWDLLSFLICSSILVLRWRQVSPKKDNKSHSFKHLHSTATCLDSYNSLCFKIIDKANSKFDLKIKEALHINWRKLKCTRRSFSSYPFTIASVPLAPFCLCLFFFCCFLHFSFIYCFHHLYTNYRHLLLS